MGVEKRWLCSRRRDCTSWAGSGGEGVGLVGARRELEGTSAVGYAAGGAPARRGLAVEGRELESWEFGWNSAVGYATGGTTARRALGVRGRELEYGEFEGNLPGVMQP